MACLSADVVLGFVEGRLGPKGVFEVEAHTSACAACLDLLVVAVSGTKGADTRDAKMQGEWPSSSFGFRLSRTPTPELAAGSVVGRYLLISLVGRGAMGEVYSAYDPELDRHVAIKLLNVEPASGVTATEARARLLREAKAIARLSHPNVVVVFDAGSFGDRMFIAMELIEGQTLSQWLAARPRSWREVRDVFVAAGRGLAAAHAAGLVHRDFKPQNVMVGWDGKVRVTDFGLVRGLPADAEVTEAAAPNCRPPMERESDAALTRTGILIGTPLYMAPEQFRSEAADARSDQFSYAVALYEGLYGERPFAGRSIAALREAVIAGQVREAPAHRRVPARLRRVVLRGLRTDRDARYPSMDRMLEALEQDPARRRARRLTLAAVVAVVVGGTLIVQRAGQHSHRMCLGAADRLSEAWEPNDAPDPRPRRVMIREAFLTNGGRYALETWDRASSALDRYASQWRTAYASACEATHVTGEQSTEVLDLRMTCLRERLGQMKALTDIFETADEPVVAGAVEAVLALGRIERCADVALLREVVPPPQDERTRAAVEALRTRLAVVKALRDAGRHRDGLVAGAALVADARALGYKPLLAEALFMLGFLQWHVGDLAVYETSMTEAIWAAEASHHDEVKANVAGMLAGTVLRPEDAERWGRLAEATAERMGPGHEWVQSWVLTGRAAVRNRLGDYQAGAGFARQAISVKKKILQPEDPDRAFSLNNLAISLTGLGDYDGALAAIDEALAILKHTYGDRSAWYGVCVSNRGETLNAKGSYAEARTVLESAVAQMQEQLPPGHRNIAYPLTALGQAELATGDARLAVRTLERALVIREAREPDLLQIAETRFALARALWEANSDRGRALRLASSARVAFATSSWAVSQLTAVDGWLEPRCPARNCDR